MIANITIGKGRATTIQGQLTHSQAVYSDPTTKEVVSLGVELKGFTTSDKPITIVGTLRASEIKALYKRLCLDNDLLKQ